MLRHVRRLFSRDSNSNCCGTEEEDEAEASVININQYAPIDDSVFRVTRTRKDLKLKKKKKKNQKNQNKAKTSPTTTSKLLPPICQVLRFDSSSRKVDGQPIAVTLSDETSLDFEKLSIERYSSEFQEVELLGYGKFGTVYRCVNRLDGREYAIKRSKPLASSAFRQRRAKNEVHANSVLLGHVNVVRYYSSWLENGCVHIQQEYCNGGDLAGLIDKMRDGFKPFKEQELQRMLLHLARGLDYMHRMELVHLDVKPENIFLMRRPRRAAAVVGKKQAGHAKGNKIEDEFEVTYKLGDMGHVMPIDNDKELEDEGDSRYLSKELLRDDYSELPKADIFALGLTIYDAAGGGPLPQNGPEWHSIREGNLRRIVRYSEDFYLCLLRMIHLDPIKRYSAANLVDCKYVRKSMDFLTDYLADNLKN